MLNPLRLLLRRRPRVGDADASTALAERAWPYVRDAALWAFTIVSGLGAGWWAAVETVLPFGVIAAVVMAVAVRSAWLNERAKSFGAKEISSAALPPHAENKAAPLPVGGRPPAGSQGIIVSGTGSFNPPSTPSVAIDQAARGAIDGLKEAIQLQMKQLSDSIAHESEQRRNFEQLISSVLRARDAEQLLKSYSGRAEALYERLRHADPQDYADATAWAKEYGEWQSSMYDFWNVASGWVKHTPSPFPADTEKLGAVNPPDSILITPFENQHRYRTMVVAQDLLVSSKHRVLTSISNQANLPG